MNDISVEQIIKVKPPKKAMVFKVIMIILALVSVSLLRVLVGYGIVLTACFVVFTILLFRYYDAEYEYELVGNELTVDRIMAKASRRRMGVYDLGRMEIMAPLNSEKIAYKEHQKFKSSDYTSGEKTENIYVIYAPSENEIVRIAIEPSEDMLKAIKTIGGKKVYEK